MQVTTSFDNMISQLLNPVFFCEYVGDTTGFGTTKNLRYLQLHLILELTAHIQDIDIFRTEREYFSAGITETWRPIFAILAPFCLRNQFLDGVRLEVALFQSCVGQAFRDALNNFQRGLKFRSCLFASALLEQQVACGLVGLPELGRFAQLLGLG
jgi:hypothetical protein